MNPELPTYAPIRAATGAKVGKSDAVRGRPQASSREMLQEAAFELFLENSYAKTTVEQIANRAGVSRNTFFNYFAGKSDVFWVDLDVSLDLLDAALDQGEPSSVMGGIRSALLEVGRHFGPSRVPWALTQYALIGSVHELQASAITRLTAHARLLDEYIVDRAPLAGEANARAAAYAVLGATIAAAQSWANAGTGRGEFEPYLDAALSPVCEAFSRILEP